MSRYYKFLSNNITSALILEGSVEWFPVPRFDSPSIFNKILDDEKGGYFSIKPIHNSSTIAEEYIGDSLVLKTTFYTDFGRAEVIDFLPLFISGLIRIYNSEIELEVNVEPYFEYGLIAPSVIRAKNGVIFKNPKSKEGVELLIRGEFERVSNTKYLLKKGQGYLFLLYSKDLRYGLFSNKGFVYSDPYEALEVAINYWRGKIRKAKNVNKFKEVYYRSLLVLLGLIYKPSGGIIAAPTTSLPEIIGSSRNWDYRYVWIRDASHAAEALIKAGLIIEGRNILSFLTSVMEPSSKSFDHPLYSVDGTPPPAEEILDWLKGHKDSFPVRIGNAAYMQLQMDVEGFYLHSLYTYYQATKDKVYLEDNWWAIESIANWVKKNWKMKSTDLWEQRGIEKHFTFTKVMNWVALDRASRLALELGYKKEAEEWGKVSEEIRKDVLENGYSEELGHFVSYYEGKSIDGSLLALPLFGFISAKDPRFLNTLKKIEEDLTVTEGFLLRYKEDFMGNVKHPFTLLSTWLARIYIRLGDVEKASRILEKLIKCSTDTLLIGEHVDIETCEPRGNFPHVFPHSGLILAVIELQENSY